MKKYSFGFLIVFVGYFFHSSTLYAQRDEVSITLSEWEISETGKNKWIKYKEDQPGQIQNIIYSLQLAQEGDPSNKWREFIDYCTSRTWDFKHDFILDQQELNYHNIDLQLKDIYTFADVLVNGKKIKFLQNAFVDYRIALKSLLKKGKNTLILRFYPQQNYAIRHLLPKNLSYPADNQADEIKTAPFIRQDQKYFGWDFQFPNAFFGFMTKPEVTLRNGVLIDHLYLNTELHSVDSASVLMNYEIYADVKDSFDLYFSVTNKNFKQSFSAHQKVLLKKGKNTGEQIISINQPKLWWPRGAFPKMTQADLYEARLIIFQDGKEDYRDDKKLSFGIRKIELIQKKDAIGQSFYFKINNQPVYCRGYNITREVKEDVFRFSNFNMLRVWGGGKYLSDEFYSLADKYGVLIWQDFMFSGSFYPADEKFLANVREELDQQIPRINSHPCLALWCGNNEIEVAASHWGWKDKYNYLEDEWNKLLKDYDQLFHHFIPDELKKNKTNVPYLSTSPTSNWGKETDFNSGDNHYWGVWHGEEPVEAFENHIPRFASEFGLPAVPEFLLDAFKHFYRPADDTMNADALKKYLISYKDIHLLEKYIRDYSRSPHTYREWIFLSEATQADALTKAIQAQRWHNNKCSGSLIWQLNGGEGVIDWSVMDYYNNEKASFYVAERNFEPMIPLIKIDGDSVFVSVINDYKQSMSFTLKIRLIGNSGNMYFKTEKTAVAKAGSNQQVISLSRNDFPDSVNIDSLMIISDLVMERKKVTHDHKCFVPVNQFPWKKPHFSIEWNDKENVYEVKTDVLALGTTLYYNGHLSYFRDNYLPAIPGSLVKFRLKNKTLEDNIKQVDPEKISIDCLSHYLLR